MHRRTHGRTANTITNKRNVTKHARAQYVYAGISGAQLLAQLANAVDVARLGLVRLKPFRRVYSRRRAPLYVCIYSVRKD